MERRPRPGSGSGSGAAGRSTAQQAGGSRPEAGEDDRNTLQGLLRRLGAGYDDVFPAGAMAGNARVRAILVQLRDEEEGAQLAGLTELCELLSVSTEDSLVAFPTEQVVPLLVSFLGYEHSPDLMLLAARAITFLADVFPPAAAAVVRHGALPALCARLLTIEYIDLAEQSLQALEKLSHDHPGRLLDAGALVACLSYVDFFQTGVQRVAVATAASICRGLGGEHAEAATAAAPLLIGLLHNQDAKVVDSACLALTRIAEACARRPEQLEALCGLGLVASIVGMVGVSEGGSMARQLQLPTFYGLLKILATMAGGSHVVAEALLEAGISDTLRNLLASSPLLSATAASPGNVLRSAEQLGDLVGLAAALLPPIPDAAAAMLQDQPAESAEDAEHEGGEACQRAAFLRDNPALLQKFSADLLPLMVQVYNSSVTPRVKARCLATTAKMLRFNAAPTLADLLADQPVAALVAALLGARDTSVAAYGMQMAEILMGKLPDVYRPYFLKEGVVHAMQQLAASAPPDAAEAAPPRTRRSGGAGRPASRAGDSREGGSAEEARTPPGDALRAAVGARARRFHARYFTDGQGHPLAMETDGAALLRGICGRLSEPGGAAELLAALAGSGHAAVSTFELLSSGAVAALRRHLRGADLPEGPGREQALLERLGAFAAAALPPGSGADPPMALLVSKLLGALAAAEKFVVQLNPVAPPPPPGLAFGGAYYRSGGARAGAAPAGGLAAGLAALGSPLKVRLRRAADDPALRDYGGGAVLVEPLASVAQVEEFLWPRVAPPGAGAGAAAGAGDDPRSRLAARSGAPAPRAGAAEPSVGNAAARAGGAPAAPPAAGRGRGRSRGASREQPIPQRRMTRAQARLAAEAEVAAQGAGEQGAAANGADGAEGGGGGEEEEMLVGGHSDEDYGDEDEEMGGGGYVEGEDEEYEEGEEDAAMAAQVHDMHLGPSEGGAPDGGAPDGGAARRGAAAAGRGSAAARGGTPRGAATYAQAAGRPGGGGDAPQPQPHLAFYVGGALLPPGTTVFQAVQRQLAAAPAAGASGASGAGPGGGGAGGAPAAPGDLGQRLWGEVHTLTYRSWGAAMALADSEAAASVVSPRAAAAGGGGGEADSGPPPDHDALRGSALWELLEGALPPGLAASQDTLDVLDVLRCAEALNRLAPHLAAWLGAAAGRAPDAGAPPPGRLPRDAFLSSKLGPKLGQQLTDVLAICGGALPGWCSQLAHGARFLFPLEARRRFWHCTAFGLPRALHYLQQLHAAEHGPASHADREAAGSLRVGRVQRQKVRISRRRLLDSALKVFELYAGPRAQLEVEFFGEVGTGLGPTLEFYTLLSHELQRASLGIWRTDGGTPPAQQAKRAARRGGGGAPGPVAGELEGGVAGGGDGGVRAGDLVSAPQGLFPAPLPPGERGEGSKPLVYFRLLGRVVAKALQDCRLLDLPLSPLLLRLALGRAADLFDVRSVDAQLGASLERLHAASRAHAAAGGAGPLLVDGAPLDDLCLTFALPGCPSYPLGAEGPDAPVTAANLRRYLAAVVDATLGSGVAAQVAAFRAGFDGVFPLASLAAFYEDEVGAMLCGAAETWTVGQLRAAVRFDHGYTSASPPVAFLLEVLAELDELQQRRFLRFVTGSPRLPPGGLAALQPRLTVVRKLSHAGSGVPSGEGTSAPGGSLQASGASGGTPGGSRSLADGDLPSVMTCANYIKLPPYSSKEVLRERLLFAIREGQGSFDLS